MSTAAPGKSCPADLVARRSGWPLERVLFAIAGTVTIVGALLSALVSPWFLLLVAFVGINQWLFVAFGDCPASLILTRMLHVPRANPG
jgi:hypothetical protein